MVGKQQSRSHLPPSSMERFAQSVDATRSDTIMERKTVTVQASKVLDHTSANRFHPVTHRVADGYLVEYFILQKDQQFNTQPCNAKDK